jgi:tyrosinase
MENFNLVTPSQRITEGQYDGLEGALRFLQMSRRQFLALAVATAAVTMIPGCGTIQGIIDAIAHRRVRKDISTLASTDPDLTTFKQAVSLMKALPSSDNRNWTNQANVHLNHCPHGNWLFLPWHRAYIYRFEEICRELTGSTTFAMPYWNWTKNPQIPAVFFDTSSSLYDPTRTATPSATISPFATGQPVIDGILSQPNFLLFASGSISATAGQRTFSQYDPLEGNPHNSVHGFVGGNMGTYLSPLDPIFWTHHNMVERTWVDWNMKLGNPNTNDSAWTNRQFTDFFDRHGNPVTVTVFEMILYPLLTYRYDDLP